MNQSYGVCSPATQADVLPKAECAPTLCAAEDLKTVYAVGSRGRRWWKHCMGREGCAVLHKARGPSSLRVTEH